MTNGESEAGWRAYGPCLCWRLSAAREPDSGAAAVPRILESHVRCDHHWHRGWWWLLLGRQAKSGWAVLALPLGHN